MPTAASLLTALTIVVSPQGPGGPSHTWTLRCGPPGGTLPRATAACSRLAARSDPFAPVPADTMCTELYGGPEQARVTGVYRGRRVRALFKRTDGCETARWARVGFLFR